MPVMYAWYNLNTQVAIKFEHVSSKGCHNGPPPEWAVYKYDCWVGLGVGGVCLNVTS